VTLGTAVARHRDTVLSSICCCISHESRQADVISLKHETVFTIFYRQQKGGLKTCSEINSCKLAFQMRFKNNLLLLLKDMEQRHLNRSLLLPRVVLSHPEKYLHSTFL
jgi:hypothetical protein